MRVGRKGLVAAAAGLALLLVFSTFAAAADGFREGYELGVEQGKKDTPLINIVWGIVGGIIAFGVAAFSNAPDPSASRMMQLEGESSDYKAGYLEGYAQGRQSSRLLYVGGGALLPTLAFLILFL
ncbi:MAG: hypothetical protein AB1778_03065 [Candidatus Bipolaricaulota bacterium]